MNEKQKAYAQFEKMLKKAIQLSEDSRNRKVNKMINAIANNGCTYTSEDDVNNSYGYGDITEAERNRLLKALEYQNNRSLIKEDFFISLCRRALGLITEDIYADEQQRKERQEQGVIAEIIGRGNMPLECLCCGKIVGEGSETMGRIEYPNYSGCSKGRVCADCLSSCPGKCNRNEEFNEKAD